MKRTLLLIAIGFITITSFAQSKVEALTVDGKTYYGTKDIPKEIVGFYKYEKTKEPIVEIKEDGTGQFQVHDVKAYPVEYWIQTDEKGNIYKKLGEGNPNYQYVLILKYGDNGESGWRGANKGTFTRIEVTMAITLGYAIVLGERYRKL